MAGKIFRKTLPKKILHSYCKLNLDSIILTSKSIDVYMNMQNPIATCITGLDTAKIIVEAHISNGIPTFNIVGLGDKAVSESKERIRAAFSSLNLGLPAKRITINLAPANLQKEGTHYDLPIALGILAAGKLLIKIF